MWRREMATARGTSRGTKAALPRDMLFIHKYAAQVDTRSQSTQSAAEADDARAKAHDELSPGELPEESNAAQSGKRYTVAAALQCLTGIWLLYCTWAVTVNLALGYKLWI
jgi:hypothetical protein